LRETPGRVFLLKLAIGEKMKSTMVSFLICAIMITSVFGTIPQNVGDQGLSISETDGLENSSPQRVGIPSLSSNEKCDFADKSLQNVGGASLSSSGTRGLANSPWPKFRQNLNHTGVSPYDTSTNPGKLRWSFTAGHLIQSSSAIGSDGTIYVGSYDDKLYAINPNGTEKWSFTTGYDVTSSPTIGSNGTIYVSSEDGKLYAISPDGTERWSFATGFYNMGWSSPTIGFDETIYIGSRDNKLYAINSDGSQKWNFVTEDWVDSSPAIGSDGTIYVGSHDNKLYAINPDGSQKWNFTTGWHVRSSPAIGTDNTIYFGSFDNKLYAINSDGTEKWSYTTGQVVYSSPAIGSDGTIYVGSVDSKFYAINPDGTEKWNLKTGSDVISSPAIGSDGTIYIGSSDHKLYAINPDGSEKWSFMTGHVVESSPAIGSDGTIYVGSRDKKLYAIGTPNISPNANANPDQTISEGGAVQFNASSSYDIDGTIESYEWDFDASDGLWWETGAVPDATDPTPTHTYGDDGEFVATLRVTDNDNLSATDICNVTVLNVDPTVSIESTTMDVEIGLRVAGRKYNNVSMTVYEYGDSLSSVSIERLPGSPNIQMAWIPISIDFSKSYSANVTYIPKDPPNIGANPVWIYIKSVNGTINQIHHTFNVQQSKKRNSERWNHIEPWEIELNPYFIGLGFEITSHVTDPGSDDETLIYTHGSQTVTVTHLNNPPNQDPYPSPEVNPRDIKDTTTLVYEGSETITLIVKDDDNIRLGIGQGSDSISLA
jgi:outer membrane protein assembly factor BamB